MTKSEPVGKCADCRWWGGPSGEVEAPEVEAWLDQHKGDKSRSYNLRVITGIERLPNPAPAAG